MFLHSLQLKNFLSFGESADVIPMAALNVIIGVNGSGKSNFLDSIELLRSVPSDLTHPVRLGGGISDWLNKNNTSHPKARIVGTFENIIPGRTLPYKAKELRYLLEFTEKNQRICITDEKIENKETAQGHDRPYFYYKFEGGQGVLNIEDGERRLTQEEIDPTQSILAQRKDPDQYPEITHLGRALQKISIYREWTFGRYTAPRIPQKTDLPNAHLTTDAANLGLVLNYLEKEPDTKKKLLQSLRLLYNGVDNYHIQIEGGTVQVFLHEGSHSIPATRLSDGTLRYLCMLTVLCHPEPAPLVCLEEPELGLHPDILPHLAELLKEASERTQLIVTTHSDILVNALSDQPESVLVAERGEGGTNIRRLDPEELKPWLEKYRLGELWTSGEIGGVRW